jgi:hypothetical protein
VPGDPVVLPAPGAAGRALLGVVPVGQHQGPGLRDDGLEVLDVGDPGPRVHPAEEERLDLVEVADPGQVPLVEDRHPDLLVRLCPQPAQRLVEVPVRAEDIGPEMPDQPVLVGGRHDLDVVQAVPDALPPVVGEHHADVVGRTPAPLRSRSVDVPAAVHAEMGAQGPAVAEPDQQMLPARQDLGDRAARQVEGGQLGQPELAAAQGRAGQGGMHPLRGQPDGVSLGHATSLLRFAGALTWCDTPDNRDDVRPVLC